MEFKQAKDYVTTIKKRFANEPHQATYKAFLKILHHYQEEQRNIMDVLEQVGGSIVCIRLGGQGQRPVHAQGRSD